MNWLQQLGRLVGLPQDPRDADVAPASADPYGDPADQGRVGDASQDPFGDPADQHQGQQVLDASQDPYGDPGDEDEVADASRDPYGDPASAGRRA